MSNNRNSTEKGRVTTEWVRNNYSIENERRFIQKDVCNGEFDVELNLKSDEFIRKNDFILLVSRMVAKYDKVKLSYGGEYLFYNTQNVPETDNEVLERLKSEEIAKRKVEAFERKERKEYERLKAKYEPSSKEEEILLMFANNCRID